MESGGAGLFWWQVGRGQTLVTVTNINGLLFFEMLFLGLRAMFSALFTFPNEYKVLPSPKKGEKTHTKKNVVGPSWVLCA